MKTPDISETPLVRKYGARRAKLFARLWFPLLYGLLIALTAGFFVLGPEFAVGWDRMIIGTLAGTLIVVAASLLTRMRLEFLAAIERVETRGHGDDTKKAVLILVAVVAVIAAYSLGRSQGRSSGFEDGAVWAGRSADMVTALRAKGILDVLQQTNYTRVAEALNRDIDYAIVGVLNADEHLATVRLPREIQQQVQPIREAGRSMGIDEHTDCRRLAEFRRKHPTASTDRQVVEAVKKLIEKY